MSGVRSSIRFQVASNAVLYIQASASFICCLARLELKHFGRASRGSHDWFKILETMR